MYIPEFASEMLKKLNSAGFSAYLAGGCVRDGVMGNCPHDYDITTSASPEEIIALFGVHCCKAYGRAFGTVGVSYAGGFAEITTFRTEGSYHDRRHPSDVQFTSDIFEDLSRRDFTWNAMAYHPEEGLLDPFGGREDLQIRTLRAVGVPQTRFQEDALRVLRAMRFMSRFGFVADPMTDAAMRAEAGGLAFISAERLFSELCGILMGEYAASVLLTYPHILSVFIPEIRPCIGFSQHSRHHDFTVWEHISRAVGAAPALLPVRLAMLMHDIGKPVCYTNDARGGHFKRHADVSADLADRILLRLRCDNALRKQVVRLIRYHRDIPTTLPKVRRLLGELGGDYDLLMEVLRADHLSKKRGEPEHDTRPETARQLGEYCRKEGLCCELSQLALKGDDLAAMGFSGKEIGQGLRLLLEAVTAGSCPNNADALTTYLRKIMK